MKVVAISFLLLSLPAQAIVHMNDSGLAMIEATTL
jgi:hypothetical protein